MRRNIGLAKDLFSDYNRARNIIKQAEAEKPKSTFSRGYESVHEASSRPKRDNKSTSEQRARYELKLENEDFEKFNSMDLMYYFEDKAKQSGFKYITSNAKVTMSNFKLCIQRGYTPLDVVTMIAFLFDSDQTYLDKEKLHPGILLTGWSNKIYTDSKAWLDDSYVDTPKKQYSKATKKTREWTETPKQDDASIGEW